jgi:hypothetical protein
MNLFVADLLAILRSHPIVQSLRIVTLDETPSGRLELKVRCRLAPSPYQMQIWLHAEPAALDYAYQVFTDAPLLRWDNAPHYPNVPTAPHHFHDQTQQVGASPLQGDPRLDLPLVLNEVAAWLNRQPG